MLRGREAHKFLRNFSYLSLAEAIHLQKDGNIWGMLLLMKEDLEHAYNQHSEYLKEEINEEGNRGSTSGPSTMIHGEETEAVCRCLVCSWKDISGDHL